MSPGAAFSDPVFRAYLGILAGVLLVAGLLLGSLTFFFRMELSGVWKTYRSWLWMAPLAATLIFAGRGFFIAGVTALSLLALREFARVSGLARDRSMFALVGVGIVLFGISSFLQQSAAGVAIVVSGFLLLLPVLNNRAQGALRRISLGGIAFLYLGLMFGQLGVLANEPNAYGSLCYLLFATEVSDVAGFAFGKLFGRHPLRSEISPRKTWEGALGALAVALALPWALRFSFPFFGPWQLLATGLIVGIGGSLGDLSLSALKRDLGVKDWGTAIPGHGGVLDRIDSLIFVAPLFMFLASSYNPGR